MRDACKSLGDGASGYCPPITYITVLKRHKARLFPGDANSDDGKGNVKPGTCVDAASTSTLSNFLYVRSTKHSILQLKVSNEC